MAVAAGTLVAYTTDDESSDETRGLTTTPTADVDVEIDLQRRAFERMCRDVVCSGQAILAPNTTPTDVRSELAKFTDEIEYVSTPDLADRADADGRFRGGAILIGIEGIHDTEQPDVRGVDVSISRGIHDYFQRTYLFRRDGSGWVETAPEEADVTVVTAVS